MIRRVDFINTVPVSGVYTRWYNISDNESIAIGLLTDTTGTLTIEYSPDENNVDSTLTATVSANSRDAHVYQSLNSFVRFKFTYSSAPLFYRLEIRGGNFNQLNAPLTLALQQDADSASVRPSDFKYEVALSRRGNHTTWNKFGYNSNVDIGTELIAEQGGTLTILAAASTLTIVSSSTDDDGDPAGVGARSVIVYGVDANWDTQTEVVTLNGTTNVVTSTTWLGLNRVAVYLAGSSKANVGNITITATTGGSVQGYMPAGEGTTQQAVFFVANGHTALADFLVVNAEKTAGGSSPKVIFKGWVFSAVSNCSYLVFRQILDTAVENTSQISPSQPFVIGEKSVLYFTATTDTNDTFASCRFSLVLVKNT